MGLKAVVVVPAVSSTIVTPGATTVIVTAVSGLSIYVINTTAPVAVTLPPTPATGQIVVIQDGGQNADANNITINGNGNQINIPQSGLSNSYVVGANGTDVWLNWNGTSWGVLA